MAVGEGNTHSAKRPQQLQLLSAVPPYRPTALPVSRRAAPRHQIRVARTQVCAQLAAADRRGFLVAQPYIGCEFGVHVLLRALRAPLHSRARPRTRGSSATRSFSSSGAARVGSIRAAGVREEHAARRAGAGSAAGTFGPPARRPTRPRRFVIGTATDRTSRPSGVSDSARDSGAADALRGIEHRYHHKEFRSSRATTDVLRRLRRRQRPRKQVHIRSPP